MSQGIKYNATPQEIMDVLYEVTGEKTQIEPSWISARFQICTNIGANFDFEILGDTEAEVAQKYFDHCCFVYEYTFKQTESSLWEAIVKLPKERLADYALKFKRLKNWRETHLQTPKPRDETK